MIYAKEIKSRIDIKSGLEYYGIRFNRKGYAVCPFHGEKTPSLYIYPADDFFVCFGCGAKGDLVQFVQLYFGLSLKEALRKIDTDFCLGLSDTPHKKIDRFINKAAEKEEKKKEQIYDEYCCELRALNKAAAVVQGKSREAIISRINEIEKDMDDVTGYALRQRYERENKE